MADPAAASTQSVERDPNRPHATNRSLVWAAICDFAVATSFVVTFFGGPPAYSFFGVEFLAELAAAGSNLPRILSGGLAILGVLAGLAALSGAGRLPRLPLVRVVLILATTAFLVRGAWLAIELARVIPDHQSVRFRELLLSGAALVLGFLHLTGLRDMAPRPSAGRQSLEPPPDRGDGHPDPV
jgi:hypothetical protein